MKLPIQTRVDYLIDGYESEHHLSLPKDVQSRQLVWLHMRADVIRGLG